VVRDDKATTPSPAPAPQLPADAEDVVNNNRMRGEIDSALSALKLFSKDDKLRAPPCRTAEGPDESKLPLIEKAYAAEQDPAIKEQLGLVRAAGAAHQQRQGAPAEAAQAAGRQPQPRHQACCCSA
jgi:urea transport system permease protein